MFLPQLGLLMVCFLIKVGLLWVCFFIQMGQSKEIVTLPYHYLEQGISYSPKLIAGAYSCLQVWVLLCLLTCTHDGISSHIESIPQIKHLKVLQLCGVVLGLVHQVKQLNFHSAITNVLLVQDVKESIL